MFRKGDRKGDRRERDRDEDPLAQLAQGQDDNLSDDDNAAPEMQSEVDEVEKEDPLLLAIDDLEGRVVAALDDIKLHPGVRSSSTPGSPTVYEELATLLRPVMEVAAHTAPSVARTYYQGVGAEGVEASCEDVYQRVVSDLVLPVLLEMAQSDTIPAKRGASLEFFRGLWKECRKGGSWLDKTTTGPSAGPYGAGSSSHSQQQSSISTPAMRSQQKRRQAYRQAREGEILRYWVQASIACTLPGAFTSDVAESAVASRGVIAASASLRPSLKHIAQRIRDADDRGANKIFGPVMKMVEGVLKKLFLSTTPSSSDSNVDSDSLRSACIKFIEIVCLCCSSKPKDASQRRRGHNMDDFSLEDLPAGHPIITREALESIAEYAFSTLRGLALMGGQVKIDINLLSDMMLTTGGSGSPSAQVVSILKPAALAYLEIESSLPPSDADNSLELNLDRSSIDFDFMLAQKSYALTVNAVATLTANRPVFFKDGAVCLARRAADPPVFVEGGPLSNSGVLAIKSHVRASCLTLLRNALSATTNSWKILHKTLKLCDMEIQADKALSMARQTTALKTAGRAARNRANMFYEWDNSASDQRVSKRQRETDDALAKMRAAKKARGLGHGIQLPSSMVDATDLIFANLTHLPKKRPASGNSSKRKAPITLDFVVDAVMTNGASLAQEEGRWYSRDGGSAWSTQLDAEHRYQLNSKLLSATVEQDDEEGKSSKQDATSLADQKKMYHSQSNTAAAEAVGRIVAIGAQSRHAKITQFAHQIAARLAWSMQDVQPPSQLQPAHDMASETISQAKKRMADEDKGMALDKLNASFPLVTSCLALESTSEISFGPESVNHTSESNTNTSLSSCILNEAYLKSCITDDINAEDSSWQYDSSLDVFVGAMVHASERANDKPNNNERKRVAAQTASSMQRDLSVLPRLTSSSLTLASAMCDIDEITKRAAESARKAAQQTIATSAALNAAKQAAEKRATAALLVLRDAAFQRSNPESRRSAVACAVGIAAGRLPASASCEDKALKLVMNVLFPKCDNISDSVVDAATEELTRASDFAIENYKKIRVANKEAKGKESAAQQKAAFAPDSEEERQAMEKVRKPIVLFMALCIRRPEIIKTLLRLSAMPKADVLSKTVRQNMTKLARAAGLKHGAATISLQVAEMTEEAELPLLLAFLDNLAPSGDKNLPSQEFIDACHKIQESKIGPDGKKDARFLIPVASAMLRESLVAKLPEFVMADDNIFLAALVRMGDRVGRQALLFREEPDPETPSLKGMTLCEQIVFLHKLDFAAAGLPQKRYLDAIRVCLDNDEIFNDRLVMSALDHMSGTFLTGAEPLPLAYMRTIILVCSKHETLQNWICHVLLPRLVEGKIYTDKRQWEGWMRCAKMLETTGDNNASSIGAIEQLPPEQLEMYRKRHGNPT